MLRIEDLDAPRVKPGAAAEILASLAWLGIDFDETSVPQSQRGDAYVRAMETLAARGMVFASPHSRAEVRAAGGGDPEIESSPASAPHESVPLRASAPGSQPSRSPASSSALCFPPSLRPPPGAAWEFTDQRVNHRLRIPEDPIEVLDEVLGAHRFALAETPGDPIIWSKAAVASYQLAVVIDDGAAGVTDVVRGEDLLPSAAIQTVIARALGLAVPRWWHLPCVLDADGRRLSKCDGDLSLATLRERGVDPRRVIGLVAHWIGALDAPVAMEASAFIECCTVERLRVWSRAPRPRLDRAACSWLTAG